MVLTAILIAYIYTRLAVGECDILRRSCGQVLFTEVLTSWIEELCWQTLSLQVSNCRRWRSVRRWQWRQVGNGCCRSDDGRARAKSVIAVWRFSGTLTALHTCSVWRPLIVATVRGIMSERKYYRDWGCEAGPLSALVILQLSCWRCKHINFLYNRSLYKCFSCIFTFFRELNYNYCRWYWPHNIQHTKRTASYICTAYAWPAYRQWCC